MTVLLVVLLLLVAAGVAGAAFIALRSKASFEQANELLPGVATSAPASWAGSHEPEARLHRRLRDAMAALRANQAFDHDGTLLDLRVDLEQNAIALDEQLVATAALPVHLRGGSLEKLAGAVETIEQAVADLAGSSSTEISGRLALVLDDVRSRTGLVARTRAALDALGAEADEGDAEVEADDGDGDGEPGPGPSPGSAPG